VARAPGPSRTRGLLLEGPRERDGREKPTTSTKRSGQFPNKPNPIGVSSPKEATSPKGRGYPPSPKSNFAAFSGKGHEAIFEFHASPLPGGSPRRRISLALLQPTPGDSDAKVSVGGLVWPSGLSRRPDWISALAAAFSSRARQGSDQAHAIRGMVRFL
jgi:hypothetical protein